jgi:deazaflavin-dependent oxidoreductase (nitroreductase family)
MPHYQEPDWATRNIFNPAVALATKLGLSMRGSRLLAVRGRKTGAWHTTPVNLLEHEGGRYLVAPRGETQWVRNIRVAGDGELRLGRKTERITVQEVPDTEKPAILRAYLKLWKSETSKFFGGVTDAAPEEELQRIAPEHPVFRLG